MSTNDFANMLLLLPDKDDIERNKVEEAWTNHNGSILRIGRFWEPPVIENKNIKLYGNNIFCLILAQKLGLSLISPADDIISHLNYNWVKREIEIRFLSEIESFIYPCFIKPLVPKLFTAKVFLTCDELSEECSGLEGNTKVIISEKVIIEAEVRSFILDNAIETLSFYEGTRDIEEAKGFIRDFIALNADMLPKTLVIDVGYVKGRGWAVIETNAVWGAGLNGCDPLGVAKCLVQSTEALSTDDFI